MSKPSGNQTTRTEPPKFMVPFLQQGMREAQNQYAQGPAEYYPGQTVVGFSPETEAALGMQANRAQNGSPVMGAANQYAQDTLRGNQPLTFGSGNNPYLDSTFNHAADQVTNRLQSDFAGSGRNTGAARPVAADELSQLATGIYGGDYNNERNRMASELSQNRSNQMGVLGMAPGLAASDYNDINRLADVGTRREDLMGRQQQDAAARWDYGQNAQGTALDQYLGRLQGYPGSVTTQPTSRNAAGGALGGAMLGGQILGPWGALGGGILGGIFG